jgi:hypothetical protein
LFASGARLNVVFGVVAVGSEAQAGLGSVGCTSLIRVNGEVIVNFSLRNWPEDAYHALVWELTDPDAGAAWALRGGGVGGSPGPDGRGSYEGSAWFARCGASRVALRARLGDDTLLHSSIELQELPAVVCDIDVLDVIGELPDRWQDLLQRFKQVEPRRAIADAVMAVGCRASQVRSHEFTPIALERWEALSRLVVHVAGPIDAAHDQALWWLLRMPGHAPQWAVLQQYGSGGIAHLLLADGAKSFDHIRRAGGVATPLGA